MSPHKSTQLSDVERDVLIDHLDGVGCRYVVPASARGRQRKELWLKVAAVKRLVHRKLLRRDFREKGVRGAGLYSWITDEGRAAVSALLGDYADALLRAAYGQDREEHAYPGESSTRRDIHADGSRADRQRRGDAPRRRDAGLHQPLAAADPGGAGRERETEGRDDEQDRGSGSRAPQEAGGGRQGAGDGAGVLRVPALQVHRLDEHEQARPGLPEGAAPAAAENPGAERAQTAGE